MRSKRTVQMQELNFDEKLFIPMKSKTKADGWFSAEGGLMKGTNYAVIGDPGVGKTTVMMDYAAELETQGYSVLFISGEMNEIDMYGYAKRFPKFKSMNILFLGNFIDGKTDVEDVIEQELNVGYDVVLVDSMAEVQTAIVDSKTLYFSSKKAESLLLNMFEKHNKGKNSKKVNTSFLVIQQVTKSGQFAGSNRFKHMMTGMAHLQFQASGRVFYFSKNRRGGHTGGIAFSLDKGGSVEWLTAVQVERDQ